MNAWSVPGYTETRELGSGGSGRVVLAVHDATGVPVAVKYLSERLRTDAAFVQGFRAEARLLGGLDSPYVVGLYEYVEAPQGAAIVMELVDGIALRALLQREGATGPEAALVVLKGSLLGLAAAHRAGVVHRDYKPENVLVAADGSSKLVDFGIAAGRGSTPGVAGTPAYMAPEQWNGEPASPAADVYAATATFYECLTGRKPFTGENFAELALQHIDAPVPDEDAPEPVRPLIRRGMAKEPRKRPENAEAFVTELEEIMRRRVRTGLGGEGPAQARCSRRAPAAALPLRRGPGGGNHRVRHNRCVQRLAPHLQAQPAGSADRCRGRAAGHRGRRRSSCGRGRPHADDRRGRRHHERAAGRERRSARLAFRLREPVRECRRLGLRLAFRQCEYDAHDAVTRGVIASYHRAVTDGLRSDHGAQPLRSQHAARGREVGVGHEPATGWSHEWHRLDRRHHGRDRPGDRRHLVVHQRREWRPGHAGRLADLRAERSDAVHDRS